MATEPRPSLLAQFPGTPTPPAEGCPWRTVVAHHSKSGRWEFSGGGLEGVDFGTGEELLRVISGAGISLEGMEEGIPTVVVRGRVSESRFGPRVSEPGLGGGGPTCL